MSIFGSDYETNDGTCVRDYIHVNDLANAHLQGLDYLNKDKPQSVELNLGNGKGFSVKEVIQKVEEITNKEIKIVKKSRRAGDPSILVSSNEKSKSKLGFEARYTDMNEIIKTLI